MKAIVYPNYGSPDVFRVEEIEKPIPEDNEVLIEIRAASVNPADLLFRGASFIVRILTGLRKPKDIRLGRDVAGRVEAVGAIRYLEEGHARGKVVITLEYSKKQ